MRKEWLASTAVLAIAIAFSLWAMAQTTPKPGAAKTDEKAQAFNPRDLTGICPQLFYAQTV